MDGDTGGQAWGHPWSWVRGHVPLNALVALVVFSHSVCVLVVVLLLGGHRVTVQVTLRIRALAPFVFLFVQSLNDVFIGAAFVRFVVLGVFQQHVVHVGAGVLEQLVGAVEDDESDLTVAEDAQLVRLLHQTKLPLGEGYLSVSFIANS